jgi:hypothetical protein
VGVSGDTADLLVARGTADSNVMKKPSAHKLILTGLLVVLCSVCVAHGAQAAAPQPQNPQSGSIGLEGAVTGSPPTQAASITLPRDGATVTNLPVTITGLCPNGLLVKIFKNNVFSGSVQCNNGSFSIQIDLFGSTNEIVARVFDALDQQGPDSNIIKVTYPVGNFSILNRVSLTSSYAKRGANPGETLTWPITLSGGTGPYAVTVDWGDGKTADIISQAFAGNFDIKHAYDTPGVYNVIIRATDKNGDLAFLQVVGVGNGQLKQGEQTSTASTPGSQTKADNKPQVKYLWLPLLATLPLIIFAFWLGRRYELFTLRKRLERRE